MVEEDVAYYQILDNYTIWRLETVPEVPPIHRPPSRTLSFPLPRRTPDAQNSIHLNVDVPLHKKRILIRNLRGMIEEMQQKVERIEAEVNDQDIVTNLMPSRPRLQHEIRNDFDQDKNRQCYNSDECQHFKELSVVQKQLEVLSRDKSYLEEQIVKLRLNKSADQGTDSEKRVSKLETENRLLQEKLKLSLERLSLMNKEKCQELSNKYNKNLVKIPDTGIASSSQFKVKLRKTLEGTKEVRKCLNVLVDDFQSFRHWTLLQFKQGELDFRRFVKYRSTPLTPTPSTNGTIKAQAKTVPVLQTNTFFQRRSSKTYNYEEVESVSVTNSDKTSSCNEKDSETGSDCMNVIDSIINNTIIGEKRLPFCNLAVRGNRVLCRIHPLKKGAKSVVSTSVSSDGGSIIQVTHKNRTKNFECDQVFESSVSYEQVFEAVKPTILFCMEGVNACIFLYGETGSGKTFTSEGNREHGGLLSFCVDEILKMFLLNPTSNLDYSVAELRNEIFRDVLNTNAKAQNLESRQNVDGSICLINWVKVRINSKEDYAQVLTKCQTFRKSYSSNTSHLIHTFYLNTASMVNDQDGYSAKLSIVDLAGSEKVDKSTMDPSRLREFQSVGKSLTCLGDVLHAINSRQCHIPHRSSKLTHFLQDSLQSQCRTDLIIHLLPNETNSSENISSLLFGQRTRGFETGQSGTKTPTKVPNKVESVSSTPRPRRPSVGFVNLSGTMELKNYMRRSSISSERIGSNKLSLTPRPGNKY